MTIQQEDFFREITLRICSSLDIKIALTRSFEYLQQILPIDELYLNIYDAQLGAIRQIASEAVPNSQRLGVIIPLPKDIWHWLQDIKEPVIIDSNNQDPTIRAMAALTQSKGYSTLSVPLCIEDKKLGVLILRAKGTDVYRDNHAVMIRFASDPFAIALSNALAHQELLHYSDVLLDDNRFLQGELSPGVTDHIIGESSGLKNVMDMVGQVAPRNNTVLLLGETGVGKEVIANAIHYGSTRRNGPFIKVNCGAIPEALIDSELFGHEKGAFTGALIEKRGRFERADKGTLFLDEIGELPLQAQVRLLRVLQNRELERIGGTNPIPIDIRIIAATHRNLEQMIIENRFREDLWFRINVFPIFIPPLRQRREDIPALTRHLIKTKSKELGLSTIPNIAPGALARLMKYDWSGNVRELQNIVERELIRYRGGVLSFESLATDAPQKGIKNPAAKEQGVLQQLKLDEAMALHIRSILEHTKGRINGRDGAAEILGVNPSTLRSRMEKMSINRTDY